MPTPKQGESRDKFMQRCVPMVMGEGKENDQARAMCSSMFEQHQKSMMATQVVFDEFDNYVSVKAGEPYRWMPFGHIYKGGKLRNVTPEFAKTLKLPPWKPPIKIGSHKDDAPAGGHIAGYEIRADGIYIIPELVPNGEKVFADGSYKYHSPEIVWEGALEDHKTGQIIEGPFIMGDALLHSPHLGEDAALFIKETITKEKDMETVEIPTSLWDKYFAPLFKREEPQDPPKEPEIPEEYTAAVAERDQYKAEIEAMKAEREKASRVDTFAAQLADTKVAGEGMAELLAGLDQAHAEKIMEQFKALSAQINESALTGEAGSDAGNEKDNTTDAFKATVDAKAEELKIPWVNAYEIVKKENPELLQTYAKEK